MTGKVIAALAIGGVLVMSGIGYGIYTLSKHYKNKKALKNRTIEAIDNKETEVDTIDEHIKTECEIINIEEVNTEEEVVIEAVTDEETATVSALDEFIKGFGEGSKNKCLNILRLLSMIESKENIKFDEDFNILAINKVMNTEDFRLKLKSLRQLLRKDILKYKKSIAKESVQSNNSALSTEERVLESKPIKTEEVKEEGKKINVTEEVIDEESTQSVTNEEMVDCKVETEEVISDTKESNIIEVDFEEAHVNAITKFKNMMNGNSITKFDKKDSNKEELGTGEYLGHDDVESLMDVITVHDMKKIIERVDLEVEIEEAQRNITYIEPIEEPLYGGDTMLSTKDGTPVYVSQFGMYVLSDGTILDDGDVLENGKPIIVDDDNMWDNDEIDIEDILDEETIYALTRQSQPEVPEGVNFKTVIRDLVTNESKEFYIVNGRIVTEITKLFNVPYENLIELLELNETSFMSDHYANKFSLTDENSTLMISGKNTSSGATKYRIYKLGGDKILEYFKTYREYKEYKKGEA